MPAGLLFIAFTSLNNWNQSQMEPVSIGISLNWNQTQLEPVSIGTSLKWNQSQLEPVSIGTSLNWNQTQLEPVSIGTSLNWNQSQMEPVSIGTSLNFHDIVRPSRVSTQFTRRQICQKLASCKRAFTQGMARFKAVRDKRARHLHND